MWHGTGDDSGSKKTGRICYGVDVECETKSQIQDIALYPTLRKLDITENPIRSN